MNNTLNNQSIIFTKALATLDEAITHKNEIVELDEFYFALRDSIIKRFSYTYEEFLRLTQYHLEENHGIIPATSPKGMFKQIVNLQICTQDEYEILLSMVEDRNLTPHAYNNDLAEQISQSIPSYYATLKTVSSRMIP